MKDWKWVIALALMAGQFATAASVGARPVPGVTCPTGSAQVVLDPGHGGSDTGAINQQYGLLEKNLTLAIATWAAEILQANGYTVALTRSADVPLGNSERGAIANACGASAFVEIHLNGSNDSTVNYTQTFWGKKRKDLAFSQAMSEALNALGIPNNGVGQFANGGLLTATMPSTLAETVFITSAAEGPLLADPSNGRVNQIASAIAAGVQTWIG